MVRSKTGDRSIFGCAELITNPGRATLCPFVKVVSTTECYGDYLIIKMTEDRSEGIHATISIRLVKAEGLVGSQSAEGSKYSAKLEYKKVTLGESAKLEQKEVNSVEWNQVLKYACNLRSNTDINSLCSAPFIVTLYEHKQKEKKQKEGKTEEIGQASFDCLPLIRVQKIRGAYQVMPFFESEYIEKSKCPTSLLEEALQTEMKQTPSSQSKEKKGLNMVVPKTDRKINSRNVLGDAERMDGESERLGGEHGSSATDSTSLATRTAQQYVGAQSYIVIEIRLDHPLVPKRTIEEIDQKVNAYVSSRQELPTRRSTAEKAVKEYHKQIAEVSQYLLLEFKSLFASIIQNDQLPVDSESAEQLKQELFYSLNSSGKYFAFKERLKFAVIKIVREKFFRTSPFTNQEELQVIQARYHVGGRPSCHTRGFSIIVQNSIRTWHSTARFLRDLFVYLVDEMHIGLRKVFKPRELAAPVQLPILNCETLLRFAREAEDNEDYDAAKKYYQERVAREQCNSEYWVDFGTFYLGQGNMEEAEECFRKGLASDQGHIESLILCGLTAAMGERFEEAADFLEAAVTHNERNPIAWTVLGLFHQTVSNDIGSEMALNEASKLRDDEGGSDVQISVQQKTSEATAGESSVTKQDSLFEEAKPSPGLITMDETEAGSIDQGESSGWSAERKPKTDGLLSRAQSQHVRRTATMSRATKGQKSGAKSTPRENGQSLVKDKPYQPSVFVKTAKFLLDHHAYTFASAALSHELISLKKQMEANESHARKQSSSVPVQTNLAEFSEDNGLPVIDLAANGSHPKSFIQGLSEYHMLCARLFAGRESQKYDLAEQNLKLVTKLDPEAVDAWSQLGHLRFMSGAISEARHLFERCVALTTWPPNNPHLLILRLGSIYLQEREFQKAKDLFLTASKTSPTALTWLGVGAACYRLNELDNAEEALTEANFLDNRNPKVWGYLTLISLKTNRRVEAEQAYKYAIKMRLQEQSLLDEIHALQAECGFGNPLVSFETDRQWSLGLLNIIWGLPTGVLWLIYLFPKTCKSKHSNEIKWPRCRLQPSTRLFMISMTICDILGLCIDNLRFVYLCFTGKDLRLMGNSDSCGAQLLVALALNHLSAWHLTYACMERFIITAFPSLGQNRKHPLIVPSIALVTIYMACIAGNAPFLIPYPAPCFGQNSYPYYLFRTIFRFITPSVLTLISVMGLAVILIKMKVNPKASPLSVQSRNIILSAQMMMVAGILFCVSSLLLIVQDYALPSYNRSVVAFTNCLEGDYLFNFIIILMWTMVAVRPSVFLGSFHLLREDVRMMLALMMERVRRC
ncbi:unnamed protein product [Calicophoron daubneyi]|uniref:Tetratricopeptide repeat protein 18 n=1 Tax=Calicophoron daubneyi TaxID=300641 RepID=A0AAV2TYT8_CALDB